MGYAELLKQKEWNDKCSIILKRENYRCKKCGAPGYRNLSCISYDSRTEIDKLFRGVTIDDINLVDFIESMLSKDAEARKLHATFETDESGNQYVLNGYYCPVMSYKLLDSKHSPDSFIPLHFNRKHVVIANPFSENPLIESDILGWVIESYYHKLKTLSNSRLSIGTIYKFPYKLTDKYVVSIWNEIGMLCVNDWGDDIDQLDDIVIHISHDNYYAIIHIIPHDESFKPIYKSLNIHHEYYIRNKAPWEYEDDALVCYCNECHEKIHRSTNVPVYRTENGANVFTSNAEICNRCGGSGYIPEYKHVENGICFKCWGEGVVGIE